MKQINLLLLCCTTILFRGYAQEVLLPAGVQSYNDVMGSGRKSELVETVPDTLELPFFDDFSRQGNLPHSDFWTDEYAFINNSYSSNPVTVGIATLDAIYSDGKLNGTSEFPFESDFLTSLPLNLLYPGRNDIFLSFFYQPAGMGDNPEAWDSLTVEFWVVDSNSWETVWSLEGLESDTFQQVYIPVKEDRYLKKGFRFRFMNYASLASDPFSPDKKGNVDHWHIDYVYLDKERTASVTALHDVSMISSVPSLLKTYEAIPWTHFAKARLTEIKPAIDISYRNNDTTKRNVTRILKITDLNYLESDSVNGGAANVEPGIQYEFSIPFNYPFIFYEADSTVFEVLSYLITEDQDYKWNDTVVRYQKFINYYAYDDGSAENGYGVRGEGTSQGMVACQYYSYKKDTLRAVQMYFNRTFDDYTQKYFRLAVWDHNALENKPGNLLYSHEGALPRYEDELNKFVTYDLDTILVLDGTFYAGWIKTTETILNVGFDRNINNQNKLFYNIGQDWINTSFTGSIMLRPVMGKELSTSVEPSYRKDMQISVYPNPARETLHVEWADETDSPEWVIALFDIHGRLVLEGHPGEKSHSIAHLPGGIYILKIHNQGTHMASRKLMIIK